MFDKDKPQEQDILDGDSKFYRGLWTLSLVLAEIAREGGDNMDEHKLSCPSTNAHTSTSQG